MAYRHTLSLRAFSLVELSIVLVILGLLVGGVLSGQSLIHASELRAVSSEYETYMAATRTFQDKYFALPGDMPNATTFWNKGSGCSSSIGVAGSPGTCNGNGDGNMTDTSSGVSTYSELFLYWQQLAYAGLITGSFSGVANPAGWSEYVTAGVNVPKSRYGNGAWSITDWANSSGDGTWLNMQYGVSGPARLMFGLVSAVSGAIPATGAALMKPEDVWNIDTKMDDGMPATGNVRVIGVAACTNFASGATAGISTAVYQLSNTNIGCALMFDHNGIGTFK